MHSINENSFIDDSLITSIEYLLFVDEMRKKDKYFHPDHINLFVYKIDRTNPPILGIRASDTIAFCNWLTEKDSQWSYRMPTAEEAKQYPINKNFSDSVGYWVNQNDSHDFFWETRLDISHQPLNIDLIQNRSKKNNLDQIREVHIQEENRIDNWDILYRDGRDWILAINLARYHAIEEKIQFNLFRIPKKEIFRYQPNIKDTILLHDLEDLLRMVQNLKLLFILDTDRALKNVRILEKALDSALHRASFQDIFYDSDFSSHLTFDHSLDLALDRSQDKIQGVERSHSRRVHILLSLSRARILTLDVLYELDHFNRSKFHFHNPVDSTAVILCLLQNSIDLLKLQLRSDRESSAFEGIRIAKDRRSD